MRRLAGDSQVTHRRVLIGVVHATCRTHVYKATYRRVLIGVVHAT